MIETIEDLLDQKKPTRLMHFEPGDPGPLPISKIGGVPFWPAGRPRPTCEAGHLMSFFAQFLADDHPEFKGDDTLVSLHYCVECAWEGNMSFGFGDDQNPSGYSVHLFSGQELITSDGLGIKGEPVPGSSIEFNDAQEVMGLSDVWLQNSNCIIEGKFYLTGATYIDYPHDSEDFIRVGAPICPHNTSPKIGGWPYWVQDTDWIDCPHGRPFRFLAQVTDEILPDGAWASGGCGYLWICPRECEDRKGEMTAQYT